MPLDMYIVCSDMEGVFTPEIWINFAEKTGIQELRLTTRDISDYDVLMKQRLAILADNNLKLQDIQTVIASMDPLPGARRFLSWLRSRVASMPTRPSWRRRPCRRIKSL
jgi:phosphoserine/homoserine phosphotransferase